MCLCFQKIVYGDLLLINCFGPIGHYSRPPERPLLSTLVDKTSCDDFIMPASLRSLYKSMQTK